MSSLNKVMLIGNVGKDPDVRYLEGSVPGSANTKVAQFTLATTERFRDRDGALRENTEWHNIVAWRGLADTCEKYVRKGTPLYVEGKIKTRSWNDASGNKRYTTEIQADNIQLLGRRPDAQDGGYPQQVAAPQPAEQSPRHQVSPQGNYQQASRPVNMQPSASAQAVDLSTDPSDDLPF